MSSFSSALMCWQGIQQLAFILHQGLGIFMNYFDDEE